MAKAKRSTGGKARLTGKEYTMIRHCNHCKKPFKALRKDKQYCSPSCKQMAYVKRQDSSDVFFAPDNQNVNDSNGQLTETSIGQPNNPRSVNKINDIRVKSIDFSDDIDLSDEENDEFTGSFGETSISKPIQPSNNDVYVPVKCNWMNKIYEQVDERGHQRNFCFPESAYKDTIYEVVWVSGRYRSLLECVLTISEMKMIAWSDVAELTNAFTFLITTDYFRELPNNYPYKKDIVSLRDKLKQFCLETQDQDVVQFSLKFETKKALLLQRYELASAFPKMSFNQLQEDFNEENCE